MRGRWRGRVVGWFWGLLCAAATLSACSPAAVPSFHATDITGAGFGRDFSLVDPLGVRRTLADYRGRVVILFFGYTHCPDVCPTALARFAAARQALGADAGRVQVLFVTLDPERDTAERLAAYVPWFDPSFVGLRGDRATTDAAAAEFKIYHRRQAVEGGMGYVIDHSAGAYVFDPAGRLRLHVGDALPTAGLVADLRQLLAGG